MQQLLPPAAAAAAAWRPLLLLLLAAVAAYCWPHHSVETCRFYSSSKHGETLRDRRDTLQLQKHVLEHERADADCATLHHNPQQFRWQLEAALLRSVMVTAREVLATSQAVHTVVQILRRVAARKASNGLQLQGRRVTIDRIAVAGSVGKSVTVQGQFDVDLVVFINLPRVQGVVQGLDMLKPEVTCSADWMVSLRRQLCKLLQQQLRRSSQQQQQQQQQGAVPHCILRCTQRPRVGRAAVTCGVAVTAAGVQHGLSFDVLLAPNLASGAGAAAAAAGTPAVTSSSSSSSIAQRQPPAGSLGTSAGHCKQSCRRHSSRRRCSAQPLAVISAQCVVI
jgi:hypothetical protein